MPQRVYLGDRYDERKQLEQGADNSDRARLYVQPGRRPSYAELFLPEKDGKRDGKRNQSVFTGALMTQNTYKNEQAGWEYLPLLHFFLTETF